MSGILVVCEHENGSFKKTAAELLGKAAELGGPVSAFVAGDVDASSLGSYGAGTVYQAQGDNFTVFNSGPFVRAVQAAVATSGATVVLAPANAYTKEAMARLAARLGVGLGTEITELRLDGDGLVARRPQYAGKALTDIRISSAVKLFTVRPNSFPQPTAGGGSATVEQLSVSFSDTDLKAVVVDREVSTASVADLTEAERIVSGGCAVKSKE
jgi:electron transfer flavoprotein alpha subunit